MSSWLILFNGALVLAVTALVGGTSLLSALLIALPVLGLSILPGRISLPAGVALVATCVALGLLLPWVQGLGLERRYGGQAVWWSVLVRGWCCSGIVLGACGLYLRCDQLCLAAFHHPYHRLALAPMAVLGTGMVLAPLALLYVPQITAPDAAKVLRGSATTELTLTGSEGVRLAARYYRPTSVDRPRGLVVFTHGFGGWKEGFLNHLTLFTRSGWSVLAYDLRGHGRSSPAMVSFGGKEQDDLIAIWPQAQRLAGGVPVVAYGVSLGSGVVLMAGNRLPRCAGILVESPFADLGRMLHGRFPPPLQWSAQALAMLAGVRIQDIRPGTCPVLHQGPPLLIGWIGDDATIPSSESAEVATQAPQAQVLVMPHGEHLDTITWMPWRQAVIDFLGRLAPQDGYHGAIE